MRLPARFLLLLLAAPPVWSAQPLPWSAALEQAWARHPQARALEGRTAEAEARRELAEAATPGPASLTLGHLGDSFTGNRGKREWEVEVAAPLWLPGLKAARRGEAAVAGEELAAQRDALRLQIAGDLRGAWQTLAGARNTHDLSRRRTESARALEADVLRRYQAGDLARVDANLAQRERLAAEAEESEADARRLQAEQAWRALTGLPAPESLESEARTPAPVAEHPRLAQAAAAVRAAEARLRVAESSRREAPELALRLVRDRGSAAESYANAVGVQLKLPFPAETRMRADSAAARAHLAEAEAALDLLRQGLELDAATARSGLAAAERQRDLAREARRLAADNLQLMEKAFALGESDLTALLRHRAAAFEAEGLLQRRQDDLLAARSRLQQALGVLP